MFKITVILNLGLYWAVLATCFSYHEAPLFRGAAYTGCNSIIGVDRHMIQSKEYMPRRDTIFADTISPHYPSSQLVHFQNHVKIENQTVSRCTSMLR